MKISLSSVLINGTQSTLLSRAPGFCSGNFPSISTFIYIHLMSVVRQSDWPPPRIASPP